jgi:hypothetical protein
VTRGNGRDAVRGDRKDTDEDRDRNDGGTSFFVVRVRAVLAFFRRINDCAYSDEKGKYANDKEEHKNSVPPLLRQMYFRIK